MKTLQEKEKELEEEFAIFGDNWEMKYEYLIDKGKKLLPVPPELKNDHWLVKGCQSKVWLVPEKKDNVFVFLADSDALITKGIVSVILELLNHRSKNEILQFDGKIFDRIGLMQHLSPTRANGLLSMIQTIKNYAQSSS